MEQNTQKFKKGIICSSIVVIALSLYCVIEMIVSWCVPYALFVYCRLWAGGIALVLILIFSALYKKIGVLPILVCSALFFALMIDIFYGSNSNVFFVSGANVNYILIFPLIMYFEKYRDLSHPQNYGATDLCYEQIVTFTIVFVITILIGLIILIVALNVKKSKLDIDKASKILNRSTLGVTVFLFVEFMRCMLMLASQCY